MDMPMHHPDGVPEVTAPPAPSIQVTDAEAIQSLVDTLKGESSASQAILRWWFIMGFIATSDLQTSNDLNENLMSPLLNSDFDDDLLTTPTLGSADMSANILTSLLLDDYSGDSFKEFSPIFFSDPSIYEQYKPAPPQPEFDGMFRISSTTPLLNSALFSTFGQSVHLPFQPLWKAMLPAHARTSPQSLILVDAPTQPRKYFMPSPTSRKGVPATWVRRCSHQAAFG